jgi:uncharacterized protein YceK
MRFLCWMMCLTLPGCSFFAAHYDRTSLTPYAGVQRSGKTYFASITGDKPFNFREDQPRDHWMMTKVDEGVSLLLLTGYAAIDLPFSLAADTVLLPIQAYWYCVPGHRPDFVEDDEWIELQHRAKKGHP